VELSFDGATRAVCEDNYFDLAPGQKRTIGIVGASGSGNVEVRALNANPASIPTEP